jgi:DNA-binding GntR family transcriptional regulator
MSRAGYVVELQRVRRETVPDQVADTLRSKILSGELPPGYHLREVELARQLGVSRGVLREAFRQLMGERLVVAQPHRGTFIWEPSAEEIQEISTLRAALECMSVLEIVATGRRAELIAGLQPIVAEMQAAEAAGKATEALDRRFHEAIIRISGDAQMQRIWARTHASVWLANLPELMPPGWSAFANHHPLLELMESGSSPDVQQALIAHIRNGMQLALLTRQDNLKGSGQ